MNSYIESTQKQFRYYKSLADQTIAAIPEQSLFWKYNEESNSIAVILNHISGNLLSRWSDFLTSDGEKSWRDRDSEFVEYTISKEEILEKWERAWAVLFDVLDNLTTAQLEEIIYIRNMGQTVVEAINRQTAHYAYHIGQIVYVGRMILNEEWVSLSIPKNNSKRYNDEKFGKPKRREHFTDDL